MPIKEPGIVIVGVIGNPCSGLSAAVSMVAHVAASVENRIILAEAPVKQKLDEPEPICLTAQHLQDIDDYYIREDTHPFGKFFNHRYKKF